MDNKKIKVLIGDDSAEYGITCANELRSLGLYVVTRRKDGKVILDAIRNDTPDVVVMDAVLPGMDAMLNAFSFLYQIKISQCLNTMENALFSRIVGFKSLFSDSFQILLNRIRMWSKCGQSEEYISSNIIAALSSCDCVMCS